MAGTLSSPGVTLNISYSHSNLCFSPSLVGLSSEECLHHHPRSDGEHSGGLLEDGVGVEVSSHCHAHSTSGGWRSEWM